MKNQYSSKALQNGSKITQKEVNILFFSNIQLGWPVGPAGYFSFLASVSDIRHVTSMGQ